MIHFKTVKHLEDGRVVETTHRLRGGLDAGFMMNGIRYSHQMLQVPAVLERLARRYPSLFIHRGAVIDVLDAIPTPPEEDEDEKDDEEEDEEDEEEKDDEEEDDEEEDNEEESSTTLINEENGSIKEEESDEEEEGDTTPDA